MVFRICIAPLMELRRVCDESPGFGDQAGASMQSLSISCDATERACPLRGLRSRTRSSRPDH